MKPGIAKPMTGIELQNDADIIGQLQRKLAHYRRLAYKDELTDLLNRHGFREEAGMIINVLAGHPDDKRRKITAPVSLIFLDADNFKQINDSYSHDAGDAVLKSIARTLEDSLRKSDVCARWGGEEFVVLLPNTEESGAMRVAEKIRRRLAGKPATYRRRRISITASIGIAQLAAYGNLDLLIDQADQTMYHAKHQLGKNAVAVHSEIK